LARPTRTEKWLRPVLLAAAVLGIAYSSPFPFFWDTIQLGAKHAHHYYHTGFAQLLLPDAIDSGHPPFFGMYLAAAWMLFGKSLAVSHWAMLPFVLGVVGLLFPVGRHFAGRWGWVYPLLALALPPLSGQMVLVSPDVVLAFGFLLGLYSILYHKGWTLAPGALLLAAVSTRGMMTVVVLFLFDLYLRLSLPNRKENKPIAYLKEMLRALPPYIPSGLLALAFLLYHYLEKGWIGYYAGSEWAPSFERVGLGGLLKNGLVLGWRLADYGMVFSWAALGLVIWREPGTLCHSKVQKALWLAGISLVLLTPTFLLYSGLQQHRYLLPLLLSVLLLTFTAIAQSPWSRIWKARLFALLFTGLLTGHFWVYPDHVAQSWDTTLAHLPYYRLKEQMIGYLDEQGIPLETVGTAFPEIGPQYYKDLSGRTSGFAPKDLSKQSYILYSNVMNDFSDGELEGLREAWTLQKELRSGGVKVQLYRKP
jgi:hypothetical protein